MKKLVLALFVGMVLSGWNTVVGVGKDVERAGEKVQEVGKKK